MRTILVKELPCSLICRTLPNCLTPRFRYEKMAEMAGGKGYFCETTEEIQSAVQAALEVSLNAVKILPLHINGRF